MGYVAIGLLMFSFIFWFRALYLSLQDDTRALKFISYALATLAFLGWLISTERSSMDLRVASWVFLVFSVLFYWSYRLNINLKKKDDE